MPRFIPFDSRPKGLKEGEPRLLSAAKMGPASYWIARVPNSVDSHFENTPIFMGPIPPGGPGWWYPPDTGSCPERDKRLEGNGKKHITHTAILCRSSGDISPISMAIWPLFPILECVPC